MTGSDPHLLARGGLTSGGGGVSVKHNHRHDGALLAALVARPSHHFLVFLLPHSLAAFLDE